MVLPAGSTKETDPMVQAILQARISSSRLPGKVLKPIMGKPMLQLQIERLACSEKIDQLVVATSIEQEDNPIEDLCDELGIDCFRGSLRDVLDRFYNAARQYCPDTIVRLTGDCPLADPEVIDRGIMFYEENSYDYVSNSVKRTYPIGLDMEVFSSKNLKEAWKNAVLPSEREHVTSYLRNHPEIYTVGQFYHDNDLSQHRWTVDESDDFKFVSRVFENLYPTNPRFRTNDILDLLVLKPELMAINYSITHGEGYQKSLREDAEFLAQEKQPV